MVRTCFVTLVLLALGFGCKPVQKSSSVSQGGKYHEDLSALRPKVETSATDTPATGPEVQRDPKVYVEPKYAVNTQLDMVLDSISRINLTRKFIDGFSIQIYAGLSREEALNAKRDMTLYLPRLETEIQYVQPNFRAKTGKYFNRLEAMKDYEAIRKYFPNAIIIPDKIAVN